MRKILFLLLINIFSLTNKSKANNSFSKILGEDNSKENPLDILKKRMENINSLAPEDFLVDFKALAPPNDPDEQYQYGATSFFPTGTLDPNRNNLIASIKAFNDAHTTDNVKLFVFTGRYFVGYHKTDRIPTEDKRTAYLSDRLNNITQQIQKETDTYIDGPRYTNIFQKDWLETLDAKFTTYKSGATKVIVFFYVESILAETPLQAGIDFKSDANGFTLASSSKLLKHNIGFIWHNGLELTDWMKLNQQSVKTFFDTNLKRNGYTGLSDASGFKTCTDEIKRVFEAPLDLTDLATLVKTMNGLSSADISIIPLTKRQEYLTTIANADSEWEYGNIRAGSQPPRREKAVDRVQGRTALISLLYNLPDSDCNTMANYLKTQTDGNGRNYLKNYITKLELSSDITYGNFMVSITKMLAKSSDANFAIPKARIAFTDGSLFSDNKTGKYEYSLDSFDDKANIKINVDYIRTGDRLINNASTGGYTVYVPAIKERIGLDDSFSPYDAIIFDNVSGYDLINYDQQKSNKSLVVPAIYLKYALHKQFDKSTQQVLDASAKAAEAYFAVQSGVGALANISKGRYLWAIAEGGMTIGIVGNGVAGLLPDGHPWKSTLTKASGIITILSLGGVVTYAGLRGGAKLFNKALQQQALKEQTAIYGGLTLEEAQAFRLNFTYVETAANSQAATLTATEKQAYEYMKKTDDFLGRMGVIAVNASKIDLAITRLNLTTLRTELTNLAQIERNKFAELLDRADDSVLDDILTNFNNQANFNKWKNNKNIFLDEYISSNIGLDKIDDAFVTQIGNTFGQASKQKELAEFIKNQSTGSSPAVAAVNHAKLPSFTSAINNGNGANTYADLHVILQERVDLLKILTKRGVNEMDYTLINVTDSSVPSKLFRAATPGSHAEVKALSDAIKQVEVIEGLAPGTFPVSRLNEFTVVVKSSQGSCFPRCPHCWHITGDVKVLQIRPTDTIRP